MMACSILSCRSQVCRTSELSFGDATHPGTSLPQIAIATVTSGSDNFAVADLNGDGILDIVISDTSDHYADEAVLSRVGRKQDEVRNAVQVHPDVVLGNYDAHTITVLLNDVAHPGNLLPKVDYPVGAPTLDLAIGDMNGDGYPDVVFGTLFSEVTILLGSSANPGQLLPPHSYPVTATPAGGRSKAKLLTRVGDRTAVRPATSELNLLSEFCRSGAVKEGVVWEGVASPVSVERLKE
jgi:hypothetical protein